VAIVWCGQLHLRHDVPAAMMLPLLICFKQNGNKLCTLHWKPACGV
jgi:hypothetical protein